MKNLLIVLTGFMLLVSAGCKTEEEDFWTQNKELKDDRSNLEIKLEQLEVENMQLTRQVEVLAKLDPEARLEDFAELETIKILGRTGFYDRDKDGTKEKFIVYLSPIDNTGDPVKAMGVAVVELWDLNQEPKNSCLAKWDVTADELKKLWGQSLMGGYYRLTFDAPDNAKDSNELTVKARFTDYLAGKVLSAQKVIKP